MQGLALQSRSCVSLNILGERQPTRFIESLKSLRAEVNNCRVKDTESSLKPYGIGEEELIFRISRTTTAESKEGFGEFVEEGYDIINGLRCVSNIALRPDDGKKYKYSELQGAPHQCCNIWMCRNERIRNVRELFN